MAKTVKRPMYEELADTDYIARNRELNTNSYGYLNNALDNFNRYNDSTLNQYQNVADQYTAAQWKDLNTNYTNAMNQQAARQRNRLGTSGASSSLYNTNNLQNYYNDLATRVSANTANVYPDLINNEYSKRLQNINLYNQLFNNSGVLTQQNDIANWQIRNQNLDRQWMNDVEANNTSGWNLFANMNKGALEGFSEGMKSGNIWGGLAGGIAGTIGATGSNSYQQGLNNSSSGSSDNSSTYGAIGNIIGSSVTNLRNKYGNNNSSTSQDEKRNYWTSNYPLGGK